MLKMTSIDSGIEAECESNDCTDHSTVCHSKTMSVVPFTSSSSNTQYSFVRDSIRCASNIMALPSTSGSSSANSFHSFLDMDCPKIVIVGYNDDRAPHKMIKSQRKLTRCAMSNYVRSCHNFGTNASVRSPFAVDFPSVISKRAGYKCRKFRMAPYSDVARCRALIQNSFHQAASVNDSDKLLSLVHQGVDPNIPDELNRTALHKAACKGYTDSVRVLLENGANPNLKDNVGNTALHLAACTNHIDVITLLLKHDCDASTTDFSGRSPLQLAQSKLKILAKSNASSSVDTLKTEVLKVIDMLLLFIERKKSRGTAAASRTCERTAALLSSLCADHASSGGVIKPATLSIDDSALGKLSFYSSAAANNNNNNNNNNVASDSSAVSYQTLLSSAADAAARDAHNQQLNADIELLNLFQTRMKLSENVEGDLNDLMNNLDQLKIAIDATPQT